MHAFVHILQASSPSAKTHDKKQRNRNVVYICFCNSFEIKVKNYFFVAKKKALFATAILKTNDDNSSNYDDDGDDNGNNDNDC